jgi:hypothetical protein
MLLISILTFTFEVVQRQTIVPCPVANLISELVLQLLYLLKFLWFLQQALLFQLLRLLPASLLRLMVHVVALPASLAKALLQE